MYCSSAFTWEASVIVIDVQLAARSVEHGGTGLRQLLDWQVSGGMAAEQFAAAMEVPRGAIIGALLERRYSVFSINHNSWTVFAIASRWPRPKRPSRCACWHILCAPMTAFSPAAQR